MRHFLHESAVLRRRAPLAFAVAPLTLRMLVTAPAAVLVSAAGEAQGIPARPLAAVPGAVDMAAVAALAENDLSMAESAVEPAGGVIHRRLSEHFGFNVNALVGGGAAFLGRKRDDPLVLRERLAGTLDMGRLEDEAHSD